MLVNGKTARVSAVAERSLGGFVFPSVFRVSESYGFLDTDYEGDMKSMEAMYVGGSQGVTVDRQIVLREFGMRTRTSPLTLVGLYHTHPLRITQLIASFAVQRNFLSVVENALGFSDADRDGMRRFIADVEDVSSYYGSVVFVLIGDRIVGVVNDGVPLWYFDELEEARLELVEQVLAGADYEGNSIDTETIVANVTRWSKRKMDAMRSFDK
jgi:hypothetical protein